MNYMGVHDSARLTNRLLIKLNQIYNLIFVQDTKPESYLFYVKIIKLCKIGSYDLINPLITFFIKINIISPIKWNRFGLIWNYLPNLKPIFQFIIRFDEFLLTFWFIEPPRWSPLSDQESAISAGGQRIVTYCHRQYVFCVNYIYIYICNILHEKKNGI